MPRRRWWLIGIATLALLPAEPRAVQVGLTPETATEALIFARQGSFAERSEFHAGYVRTPGDPVRRVSLVTEYRRAVLRVEDQRRQHTTMDDVTKALDANKAWRGVLEAIVDLQFHPQNRLARVPLYDVLLVPLDGPEPRDPLIADQTDRHPRYGYWTPLPQDAPWWPFPPPGASIVTATDPMIGGFLQARFDATALREGRYDVVIKDGAATLGLATFDLGALR